ncbi:sugar phosphate isomerase/epimerase family protein [Paenibacillus radicis (ex Gao et al. 2016)]|uniref:Xylose isomerase n=1 Tax=Paenibacillus radicis (ex Gao et al. 2016) TaxID=1737354 RepID=A0A917HCV1_9BACL|nr:TIM barrel protein [Paenibacillus radicis (ex Gao et al. 2016)]GGG75173.1 xylose isomerase [Paenibacillus radicis (ex Gao et al. 2016)]
MNISIGGYSFNNTYLEGKMDVFGYLETVKYRYGLDVADLWNGFFIDRSSKPVMKLADEGYIRKIKEALDDRELRVVNFAIDGAHLWDPDPEMRVHLYKNALVHLRAAVILGAETVRIDTGGSYTDTEPMSEEQFEFTVRRYQEFSEFGADNGFRIGPENHMGASLQPRELKRLAEAVDHPAFGFLVHLGRWRADREEGDKLVAPWAYHTHFDAETASSPDAIQTIRTLRDAGYNGYWGIEHNAPADQYAETARLIGLVQQHLANEADLQRGEA